MNTENYVFIVGSCYYIQQRQRLGSVEERVANCLHWSNLSGYNGRKLIERPKSSSPSHLQRSPPPRVISYHLLGLRSEKVTQRQRSLPLLSIEPLGFTPII